MPEQIHTDVEQPSIEGFVPGTDPQEIRRQVAGLDARERVAYWRTFVPTVDMVTPAVATHDLLDDFAAVAAGAKPAALIDTETERSFAAAEIHELTCDEEGKSWLANSRRSVVDGDGNIQVFYGQPDNVRVLAARYKGWRGRGDAEFHREVGRALGYPDEAIEAFIASHQPGYLSRYIGALLKRLH